MGKKDDKNHKPPATGGGEIRAELQAIETCCATLHSLSDEARRRVLNWLVLWANPNDD